MRLRIMTYQSGHETMRYRVGQFNRLVKVMGFLNYGDGSKGFLLHDLGLRVHAR